MFALAKNWLAAVGLLSLILILFLYVIGGSF